MTARPTPRSAPNLRVVTGRKAARRSPGATITLVVVTFAVAMFGMVLARTTLDTGAFEMANLEQRIQEAYSQNQTLALQVAQLESPERIAILAEEMGMVFPRDRDTLLIQGFEDSDPMSVSTNIFALGERP